MGAIIKFFIIKALIPFFLKVVVVLGVFILYRYILAKSDFFVSFILEKVGAVDLSQSTVEFFGLAGWLADCLQIQECVALSISFAVACFGLRLITGASS